MGLTTPAGGPAGPRRAALAGAAVLVALVAVAVAGVVTFVSGALAQVSFEATEASNVQGWAARPAVNAGIGAVGCSTAGLIGWFVVRRRRPRMLAGPAVAALAGVAVLGWGHAARAGRSHPEAARARALGSLTLPDRYTPLPTQIDRADAVTAPAATRTWNGAAGAPACGDLHDGLAAWADRGTLRGSAGNTAGRCSWSATWRGHAVDANVVSRGDGVTVSVRLAG